MEEIKKKIEDLSQAVQKVGAEIYKQQGEQKPPEDGQGPAPEEGEYRENPKSE